MAISSPIPPGEGRLDDDGDGDGDGRRLTTVGSYDEAVRTVDALAGLVYGAIVGLVIGLIFQAAGPRHEFSSVRTLEADHYDITLNGGERADAQRILHAAGLA